MHEWYRSTRQRHGGFTMIELVITMLVMAILGVIAMSAYQTEVQKGRRTDAKNAVLDLASREEQLFSTTNAYSVTPTDLGYTGNAFPIVVGSGYYSVNVAVTAGAVGAPATYTITATAQGTQLKDVDCQTFTVNQQGLRTAANAGGANTTTTCW